MYFMFFQHILFSPKLIHIEPSLCFRSATQVYIMFFSVCLPKAKVIILHKSTMMHTCTGLKAFPLGSGFSFGMWNLLSSFFHSYIMEGHYFSLSSLISAHKVPHENCHGVMSSEAAGELCLCAVVGCVRYFFFWRTVEIRCVVFQRVFHLCVSKPNRQRHRLPDLLQGASGIWNEGKWSWVALYVHLSSKGEPIVSCSGHTMCTFDFYNYFC